MRLGAQGSMELICILITALLCGGGWLMCAVCVEAAILWCGALAPAPLVLVFAAYMQAAGVQNAVKARAAAYMP